jgi:hypothetical protein
VDERGGVLAADLARSRPLEVGVVAGLVLGAALGSPVVAGGILVVLWPVAAVAAVSSAAWNRSDRLVGLVAPLVVTAIGVFGAGAARARDDLVVDFAAFAGALSDPGPWIFAVAGPLGAAYLGWRLPRSVGARSVRLSAPDRRPDQE